MNKQLYWWFTGKPTTKENIINCVNDHWKPIVSKLIDDLFELGWDGQVAQVKEKFGTLRFYIGSGNQAIWDRISQAEAETEGICDICGNPGKLRTDIGWWRVLCDEHYREIIQ